jgi:hypothetical protein
MNIAADISATAGIIFRNFLSGKRRFSEEVQLANVTRGLVCRGWEELRPTDRPLSVMPDVRNHLIIKGKHDVVSASLCCDFLKGNSSPM